MSRIKNTHHVESMNIRMDNLITFYPITRNQELAFEAWKKDTNHLALVGSAGTGKTLLGMYFALELVMDKGSEYDRLHIIRSVVPTRDVGYLPGTVEEKLKAYSVPYRSAATQLFNGDIKAYDKLVHNGYISFESTSYIRGVTYDNCIILVDEMQNLNFHELDSVITRVGANSRIIFSGDYSQSDFKTSNDKSGITTFLKILEQLRDFSIIEFTWEDIVRSDFVRDYIMTKEWMGIK